MRGKIYKTKGIILASSSHKDADLKLLVLTFDRGKVSLIANGAKKVASRKRGSLEVFNDISFNAMEHAGVSYASEVEVINNFMGLRKNLAKVALSYYFSDVIRRIAAGEDSKWLYELLKKYFKNLETETKLKSLKNDFIKEILIHEGFWPEGKKVENPDLLLSSVLERDLPSARVGKKLLTR